MSVESKAISNPDATQALETTESTRTDNVNRGEPAAKPLQVKNLLVAIDFSACSMAALEYAARLARGIGASLTLVHVVEPYAYPEDLSAGLTVEEIDARWMGAVKSKLEDLRGQKAIEGILSKIIVTMGPAWHQIVDTANSLNVDLIITGTHGYTGLTHVVLGSTAEQVVRHARRPVLVVPASKSRDEA